MVKSGSNLNTIHGLGMNKPIMDTNWFYNFTKSSSVHVLQNYLNCTMISGSISQIILLDTQTFY